VLEKQARDLEQEQADLGKELTSVEKKLKTQQQRDIYNRLSEHNDYQAMNWQPLAQKLPAWKPRNANLKPPPIDWQY
jgi:hypothetical protein